MCISLALPVQCISAYALIPISVQCTLCHVMHSMQQTLVIKHLEDVTEVSFDILKACSCICVNTCMYTCMSPLHRTHAAFQPVTKMVCQLCPYSFRQTAFARQSTCLHRDCGLACALMVLKSLGVSCLTMASLRSLCSTTRYTTAVPLSFTWTIKLG